MTDHSRAGEGNDKPKISKAKDIIDKRATMLKQEYLADGVGIGYKIEDGKHTNKVALQFYVKKKKSKKELLTEGIKPIPEEIEGINTDVVEVKGGFKPRI
jgi:hypothetical protein